MGQPVNLKYYKQLSTLTTHSAGSQEGGISTTTTATTTQHGLRQPQVTSSVDPVTAASLRQLPPPPIESPSVPVKSTLRTTTTSHPARKVIKSSSEFQTEAATIVEEAFHQLAQ